MSCHALKDKKPRRSGKANTGNTSDEEAPPPSDIRRKVDHLASLLDIPRESVEVLLIPTSPLLPLPADTLCASLRAVAASLGITPFQALFMASRQPDILHGDMDLIKQKCDVLAVHLDVPVEQVIYMVSRQPLLLDVDPTSFKNQCISLAYTLDMPPMAVAYLISRMKAPEATQVLSMSPTRLQDQLTDLRESLALPAGMAKKVNVRTLIVKNPSLLASSPSGVNRSLEILSIIFRSPPETFLGLKRCPTLLTYPPENLRKNFEDLVTELQLPVKVVVGMLMKQSRLLKLTREKLRLRLDILTNRLYIPAGQVVDICVRQPSVLLMAPATLERKLLNLKSLLGITYQVAISMFLRHPPVVCFSEENLLNKFRGLLQVTGIPQVRLSGLLARFPQLLTFNMERATGHIQDLRDMLGLDKPTFAKLAYKHPFLLLDSGPLLNDRLADLQASAGLTREQVIEVVRKNPLVLQPTGTTRDWEVNWSTLEQVLGLSPAQIQSVLVSHPRILRLDPRELRKVCQRLRWMLDQSPTWQQQLKDLDGAEIAACTRYSHVEFLHLQYLVDTGQQATLGLAHWSIWNREAFTKQYPGFTSWRMKEQQRRYPWLAEKGRAKKVEQLVASNGAG